MVGESIGSNSTPEMTTDVPMDRPRVRLRRLDVVVMSAGGVCAGRGVGADGRGESSDGDGGWAEGGFVLEVSLIAGVSTEVSSSSMYCVERSAAIRRP